MNEIRFNLDDGSLETLERLAKQHGRAPADEAVAIVQAVLDRQRDPVEWSRQIRAMCPVKVQTTDSLQLIREDRNR